MKLLRVFAVALACSAVSGLVSAADDSKSTLRIETGRHTAGITDISVSADGKIIATSSDDKTVRIWNEAGRLLQTIRPPVGNGASHGIASVALSPDGSTVAYMFSTIRRFEEDNRDRNVFPVQIYHRPTDRVVSTITRFYPGRIGFSPDGKYLAIATDSLELIRTSDWELYATSSLTLLMVVVHWS